jgi:hypothetical protein
MQKLIHWRVTEIHKNTGNTQKNGAVLKKLLKMYFLPYTGVTYTVNCRNCYCYQQFASHAYCGAAWPVS